MASLEVHGVHQLQGPFSRYLIVARPVHSADPLLTVLVALNTERRLGARVLHLVASIPKGTRRHFSPPTKPQSSLTPVRRHQPLACYQEIRNRHNPELAHPKKQALLYLATVQPT